MRSLTPPGRYWEVADNRRRMLSVRRPVAEERSWPTGVGVEGGCRGKGGGGGGGWTSVSLTG